MPASSSTAAIALAGRLRALDDRALSLLLERRVVRESGIRDFFDLADALLDETSIRDALSHLDRSALAALADVVSGSIDPESAELSELAALALIDRDGSSVAAWDQVADRLRAWPAEGLPSLDELNSTPPPATLQPVAPVDQAFTDRLAAERAFAATTAVAELIAELRHESARELAKGGIALPDTKRLATAMAVELGEVPTLHSITARAGLIALETGRWMPTGDSAAWLDASSDDRWAQLAGAWLDRLPGDIRRLLADRPHAVWGERLDEFLAWLYPAGGSWMRDRVAAYTRDAERLGITADSVPSTPGTTLLTSGRDAAASAIAALLPPEVTRVYVQHDLSIVSPGPLEPRLDARLRIIADVEGRALASTYRVSAGSLTRALAAGETAESLRAFLAELSLTGIPQPLEYLIAETAAKHGLVRVGSLDGSAEPGSPEHGALSYVRSDDTALLRAIAVDHGLSALALQPAGPGRLVSRFDRDLVFWSVTEARYPIAAEDERGMIVTVQRRSATRQAPARDTPPSIALLEKLRLGTSAADETTDHAWLVRQLDLAIRGRLALTVTVAMPGGSSIDVVLEPTSVAGGRLRARDRGADIERTLPLSSITAVGPAE